MLGSQAGTENDPRDPKKKCRITEILQYTCPTEQDEEGRFRYLCYPIPRIFRMYVSLAWSHRSYSNNLFKRCQDRPAVEITKRIHIDINTGQVDLSQELRLVLCSFHFLDFTSFRKFSQGLLKGKPWRDVIQLKRDLKDD
jgi:Mitochondrial export protein Som1